MISLLSKFLDVCERAGTFIASTLLATMLVGGLANIIIREVFGIGIIWIYPWSMVFFVWMVFIGYFVVFRRNSDVAMTYFVNRLSPTWRPVATAILVSSALFVNIVVLLQVPRILHLKRDLIEIVGIPDYFVTMPLFISSALIILSVLSGIFERRALVQPLEGK
jgi:TRAP-type C4-dicarboxylate transport system permease small subunit